MTYKLLIVEDDNFTRYTLEHEFKSMPNINLLGSVKNGKEAVDFVKTQEPDIILMDIDMPVMNGIDATKHIKQYNQNIKIVMLTSISEKNSVLWAFSAGANAYCIKNIKTPDLLNIFNIVSEDGIWFDNQIASYIFQILKAQDIQKEQQDNEKTLDEYNITPRERNIIKLIADGCSNADIAEQLVISKNTVKIHVSSIIKKLALEDRTQVALFVLKNNILD